MAHYRASSAGNEHVVCWYIRNILVEQQHRPANKNSICNEPQIIVILLLRTTLGLGYYRGFSVAPAAKRDF